MGHDHTPASRNKGRLSAVLGLTSAYMLAEVVAGFWTGSLALLADAGHMLADVAGLGLALLAITYAERPPSPRRTYGYHRVEILAALVNGAALLGLSVFILYEAVQRLRNPPEVASRAMLVVAALGLVVNIMSMFLLRAGSGESLNVKGAYLEVLSDAVASVGVIVAAAVMAMTDWYAADPLISAAIGLFILPRTWGLLSSAVNVLLEGVPEDVDLEAVRSRIADVPGVADVHDLHVWSLTSGVNALSVHVKLGDGTDLGEALSEIHQRVTESFPVQHATVQVEPAGWEGDAGERHD